MSIILFIALAQSIKFWQPLGIVPYYLACALYNFFLCAHPKNSHWQWQEAVNVCHLSADKSTTCRLKLRQLISHPITERKLGLMFMQKQLQSNPKQNAVTFIAPSQPSVVVVCKYTGILYPNSGARPSDTIIFYYFNIYLNSFLRGLVRGARVVIWGQIFKKNVLIWGQRADV